MNPAYNLMLISIIGMFSVLAVSSAISVAAGGCHDDISVDDDALIYDNNDLQSLNVEN